MKRVAVVSAAILFVSIAAGGEPLPALAESILAMIVIGGLEGLFITMIPLTFLDGATVKNWSRLGWAVLFALSVFGFIHILIGPTSGYVSDLSPAAFVAALGVFAAFGALSIGTWLYFRFRRPEPEPEPEPA